MRTTIDVDGPVLRELKQLARREQKTLGALVSELLAASLAQRRQEPKVPPRFAWHTSEGGLLVDLADRERLWELLDAEQLELERTQGESE